MIRSIENTYKYRPHIPIGGLGTIAVVSGIVLAIFASRYGLNHSPFMLTMMSIDSLSFVATCIVSAARFRMVHNIEEEVDHYFGAPNGIAYLENFIPRPVLGIIRGYLTSVERVCEEPDFRETLIDLCHWHNTHSSSFLSSPVLSVLAYQNLRLDKAFNLLNIIAADLLNGLTDGFQDLRVNEAARKAKQFRLAAILLLHTHDNDQEIVRSYYGVESALKDLDDQDLFPLWVRHLSNPELLNLVRLESIGSQSQAITLFEYAVKKGKNPHFKSEFYEKAIHFGWANYLEKLLEHDNIFKDRPQGAWVDVLLSARKQKYPIYLHQFGFHERQRFLEGDYIGVVKLLLSYKIEVPEFIEAMTTRHWLNHYDLVEIDELLAPHLNLNSV